MLKQETICYLVIVSQLLPPPTVMVQFLPEDIFVSKPLAIALLLGHLGTLAYFAMQWIQAAKQQPNDKLSRLSPHYICYTMFVANFVGIAFARTLHYQFYAWYISTVPFLLWTNGNSSESPSLLLPLRILLLAGLEYAFLTFPATKISSATLQLVHLMILLQIRPPSNIQMMWEQQQLTEKKEKSI